MQTADVLSELEEIGAVGEPAPSLQRVEEVGVESGEPSAKILDERGARMVEACDRVVARLDQMVGLMQDLKGAILEMKEIWEPPVVEDEYEVDVDETEDAQVPELA